LKPELAAEFVLIDVDSNNYFKGIPFKKVLRLPFTERLKMLELLQLSDLLLLPSSAESFGVLIVEAQLLGVPVWVQQNTACAEVAGDEITSFQFSGTNLHNSLDKILTKVLDSDTSVLEISRNAKMRATSLYDVNNYIHKMSTFYENIKSEFGK
jgi:glycosyltransferase involved in cell wall biosynthesis